MSKKLKICHVITRMIVGGAQENTLLTIIGHVKNGHDVTLVTGPTTGPEGKLLEKHDMPAFKIVEIPSLTRELNPVKDFAAYFALKSFFKANSFDVVHTHASKAGILGRVAAKAAKVPFVVHTVHGQAFHRYEKPWKNTLYILSERWAAKHCDKIYAVAQAMIDQCVAANVAPREKYKVVYSGMELEPYLEAVPDPVLKEKYNIPENAFVVGCVARLFPLKGYEFLIPAAAEIARRIENVHFHIVGNGIWHDRIQQQIKDLGIADKFSFAGLVAPAEVPRHTALMNTLVHLSLREGLPRTVVQALASGIPAVGFDLDGTPEVIIDGETGFIIEPENTHEVVEAVVKIAKNPDLSHKMGENGRNLVKERFDWRKMADILEKEYLAYTT